MADLKPTRGLVDTLRLIRDTRVEAVYNEPPARDHNIRALHEAHLVRWHQAPAIRLPDGAIPPDRWVITDTGRVWLAQHDKEN